MVIKLTLPDWVEGRHLYVMAGIELVAYKYLKAPWQVKTSRCNMCGACCTRFKPNTGSKLLSADETGTCIYLKPDGTKLVCSLGLLRPWCCSVSIGGITDIHCTERFEEAR